MNKKLKANFHLEIKIYVNVFLEMDTTIQRKRLVKYFAKKKCITKIKQKLKKAKLYIVHTVLVCNF